MELQPYTQMCSFLNGISDPVTNIISLGVERRRPGLEYYYDNKFRNIHAILFQYTLSGTGCLEIDGVPHSVRPGQAIFVEIPSNTRYYLPKNATEDWTFLYLLIESGRVTDYYRETIKKSGMLFEISENSGVITFLKDVYARAKAGLIGDFVTASTIAFEFINRIYFHFYDTSSGYSSRVQRVLREINADYSHLEGIAGIASALGISENHLIREFRREVGITPMKYLTQVRLAHAKKQLTATNHSIEEIALECGYSRANYFCRVFKQNFGVTPLRYRTGQFDHAACRTAGQECRTADQ